MKNKLIMFTFLSGLFTSQLATAQDWPNIEKYKKENEQLASPAKGENRIVFMGNSITERWLEVHPDFFKGRPYIDRGISGQTTPQMLVRFRQDVISLKPVVVVLLAGINDIAQNTGPLPLQDTAGNIFSMAELAMANGIKVIMCSVLPVSDFPWKRGMDPGPKVVQLNAMLKEYATAHDIDFVDYYTPMVNDSLGLKKELGDDGVHPNLAGYAIMEPLVEKAITHTLKKKK